MSNVATIGAKLPAIPDFIKQQAAKVVADNEDLKSGLFQGMPQPPRLSIKGKVFRIVKDGNEEALMKKGEDGELEPVSSLNVVILKANKGLYKLYYAKKYNPNDDEPVAPDCYSFDGITPSPMAQHKQCETCAACPRNVWGSAITDQGNKTRECSDNKLLAVMATGGVSNKLDADNKFGQVFQLKVTPSALNRSKEDRQADPQSPYSWVEFVNMINEYPIGNGESQGVPIRAVSTKLFFDSGAAHPQLRFKMQRFLTADEFDFAESRSDGEDVDLCISEQVQAAVATAPAKPALPAPKKAAADDDDGLPVTTEPTAATAAAPPADKPKRGRKAATPAAEPPAEKAKVPAEAKAQPTSASMDDELAGLVGQFS
jgi:hypothetical protein